MADSFIEPRSDVYVPLQQRVFHGTTETNCKDHRELENKSEFPNDLQQQQVAQQQCSDTSMDAAIPPLAMLGAYRAMCDYLTRHLSCEFRLDYCPMPLLAETGSGASDDLVDFQHRVQFVPTVDASGTAMSNKLEIVQTLVKWKRHALKRMQVQVGHGIWGESTSVRPDIQLDNLHCYEINKVEFEAVIAHEQRTLKFLKEYVNRLFAVIKSTERHVHECHLPSQAAASPQLPEKVTFVHTEDLIGEFPYLSPREREDEIAAKYGAVFVIGVGSRNWERDMRSRQKQQLPPDTEDYCAITRTYGDRYNVNGLNGSLLLYSNVLQRSVQVCSMGIRVGKHGLIRQLKLASLNESVEAPYHHELLEGELPYAIGGGIGKARLALVLLKLGHVGQIVPTYWPAEHRETCKQCGIDLL